MSDDLGANWRGVVLGVRVLGHSKVAQWACHYGVSVARRRINASDERPSGAHDGQAERDG